MRTFILLSIGLSFTMQAWAADSPAPGPVKVSWQNPEKFSDIRPASGSKKSYQARVIKAIDKIWLTLAKDLPPGYQLSVNVKDVDLAGDVNPMYRLDHNDIRVVKEIYFPRMTIDYKLTDASGMELASGQDVKIKDMAFMHSTRASYSREEFAYEKEMLRDWYKKHIESVLNPKK